MHSQLPETKEQYSSLIPALKTLIACGWEFISAEACLAQRGHTRELLLKNDLNYFPKNPNIFGSLMRHMNSNADYLIEVPMDFESCFMEPSFLIKRQDV